MASVNKRRWTYQGQTNEAWVVRYTDQGGKRRMKTFDLKKDADRHRLLVETEIEKGEHVAAGASLRVTALVALFIENARARHRERRKMGTSRLVQIERFSRLYIVPHLGRYLVSELQFRHVEDWACKLSSLGKLSPTTVDEIMRMFRGMVDFAIKRRVVAKNIVREVMKDRGAPPRVKIRTLSREDVASIFVACEMKTPGDKLRDHLKDRLYIHLAAMCGLRRGEISGLTLGSVDVEQRLIRVRHNLTMYDELKGPKTKAGIRDIPMPVHIAQHLRHWLAHYYVPNDRELVFRTKTGGHIHAGDFVCRSWRKVLKRAGLLPTEEDGWHHFHALRHFAASVMIEAGLPLTDVAALLGHEKFDVTLQVYAHPIVPGHRRLEVIDRMAAGMLPPPTIEHEAFPALDGARV